MAELQVALDLLERKKVLDIAEKCSKVGAHLIEAGTPLIKSQGIKIVSELKRIAPEKRIVADMKTMDTGYLETQIAAKAGADVVSILAAANDNTIKNAVRAGRDFNVKVCCDLINVKDPVKRAKELEGFGVDYVSLHVGIDQQSKSEFPYPTLKKLCEEVKIPVAAAGGLTHENIKDVINAGAQIIIVGSFITKSDNPTKATELILKEMR